MNNREEVQEDGDDLVPLPRARPAEFEVYVYWLYTSEVVTTDTKGMNSYGTTLVRFYIFGEYLKDESFKDAVFEVIFELCEDKSTIFESAAVKLVWRNLPRDDVLRDAFLEGMLAHFLGKPGCAKYLGSHDWSRGVDAGSVMAALERRQYIEYLCYGGDLSEVGEALTSLLGPVDEQL